MKPRTRTLTYSTDGTQGARIAFGLVVVLAGLVPSTIVAVQWLSYGGQGPAPRTGWESLVPGGAIILYGLWTALRRERTTVDARARTLVFSSSLAGWVFHRETWSFDDVEVLEVCQNGTLTSQGYRAQVRGPRGVQALRSYLHSPRRLPPELRETAEMLGKPVSSRLSG